MYVTRHWRESLTVGFVSITAVASEAPSHPATPKTPQTTPTMSLPTTPVTPVPAVPVTMAPMFPVKTEPDAHAHTPPAGRVASMYEVAAQTQELDTLIITSKVRASDCRVVAQESVV